MPLIALVCAAGHTEDAYVHSLDETPVRLCVLCGQTMLRGLSLGRGLTYFSEKQPRRIMNIDKGETPIRSPKQHEDMMRERSLTPATDWGVSLRESKL